MSSLQPDDDDKAFASRYGTSAGVEGNDEPASARTKTSDQSKRFTSVDDSEPSQVIKVIGFLLGLASLGVTGYVATELYGAENAQSESWVNMLVLVVVFAVSAGAAGLIYRFLAGASTFFRRG